MMFSVLFLSCMIAGSLACGDNQCKDPFLAYQLMEVKFLPNNEQLRTLCPKLITFLECERDFFECPGRSLDEVATSSDISEAARAKGMLGAISLGRDLCDEDSSFRHDYLESVDCFRDVIEEITKKCRQDVMKTIEGFFGEMYPIGLENQEPSAEMRCLGDAFEMACIVDNLADSCGKVAQRVAMTSMERVKAVLKIGICGEVQEDGSDLKSRFLDFLELDEKRRSNFQGVFDMLLRKR